MARKIVASDGRTVSEGDPDFDRVRLDNLERQFEELIAAVVDVQHRVAKLDGGDIEHWPGDTYGPR